MITLLKDAEKRFAVDRDRQHVHAEIRRLTNAGVSAQAIAGLTQLSERQVVRIRNDQVRQPKEEPSYRFDTTPSRVQHLERVADAVLEMACRLRDEDPQLVYDALTAVDAAGCSCRGRDTARQSYIELVMVALAAIPVDATRNDLLGWCERW